MGTPAEDLWLDQWLWVKAEMCGTKRQYTRRKDAKEHIKRLPDNDAMKVYRCDFCGRFHVGHRKNTTH